MALRLSLLVLLALAVGCSGDWNMARYDYKEMPASPLKPSSIEKVAVVILNGTDAEVDVVEVAQIFSVEMQRFEGVNVYPAAVARAAAVDRNLPLPEKAHELGRLLGVDAVIVGIITDYQPYDYPRVGVLLMVYPSAQDMAPRETAEAVLTLNRVYDADMKEVRDRVRAFAADRDAQKTPMGYKKYLFVMSGYMHFVADRSTRDLFAEAARRGVKVPEAAGTMAAHSAEAADASPQAAYETTEEMFNADADEPAATTQTEKGTTDGP